MIKMIEKNNGDTGTNIGFTPLSGVTKKQHLDLICCRAVYLPACGSELIKIKFDEKARDCANIRLYSTRVFPSQVYLIHAADPDYFQV
jgi:hypothetical protein